MSPITFLLVDLHLLLLSSSSQPFSSATPSQLSLFPPTSERFGSTRLWAVVEAELDLCSAVILLPPSYYNGC